MRGASFGLTDHRGGVLMTVRGGIGLGMWRKVRPLKQRAESVNARDTGEGLKLS